MLCSYVVLYGLLDGSFIGLISLVTFDISGNTETAEKYYGIMLTMIGVPIAVGPPVIGKLFPFLFLFLRI